MLSTVLFIDDRPVGYSVTENKNRYYFTPTMHSSSQVQAPTFYAIKQQGKWRIVGLEDTQIAHQLMQSSFLTAVEKNTAAHLSAAL